MASKLWALRAFVCPPRRFARVAHIRTQDARFLKECYGQFSSFASVRTGAMAAQARVLYAIGKLTHRDRGDPATILAQAAELRSQLKQTNHLDRLVVWDSWYKKSHCMTLYKNSDRLKKMGIVEKDILQAIAGKSTKPWSDVVMERQKKMFQRQTLQEIKKRMAPNPVERIRHKLERWHNIPYGLFGVPGIYSRKISKRLSKLRHLVNPRVAAAVFSTLWNRWCTARRYQKRNTDRNVCLLGCGGFAEDSIEHYARCKISNEFARRFLRIQVSMEHNLNTWLLNEQKLDDDRALTLVSLWIYSCYMTTNRYRHDGQTDARTAVDAMYQACLQGTENHKASATILHNIWTSEPIVIG